MSKLNRQSQHKPPRETVKSRELADLRRENHKLKKQVAQGRKTVQRVVDSNDMFRGIDRSTATFEMKGCILTRDVLEDAAKKMLNACSCGGNWKRLELGPKVIEVCDQCTARRVVKPDPI